MNKNYHLKLTFFISLFFMWWFFPITIRADGDGGLPTKAVLKIINVPETEDLSVELLNLDSSFFVKKENLIKFNKNDYSGITQWTGEINKQIVSYEGIVIDNARNLFVAYRNLGTYSFDRNNGDLFLPFYIRNCGTIASENYIARIIKGVQIVDSFPFTMDNACDKGGGNKTKIIIDFNDLNRQTQLATKNPNKIFTNSYGFNDDSDEEDSEEYENYQNSQKNALENDLTLEEWGTPPIIITSDGNYYSLGIGLFIKKPNILVAPRKFLNENKTLELEDKNDQIAVSEEKNETDINNVEEKKVETATASETMVITNTNANETQKILIRNNKGTEAINLTKFPIRSILTNDFLAIIITLFFELLIAFLMKIKNYKIVFFVNLSTQFFLQASMLIIWCFWYNLYNWQLLALMEVTIFITEFSLYSKLIKNISQRKLLVYSAVANLLSLAFSPIISLLGLIIF